MSMKMMLIISYSFHQISTHWTMLDKEGRSFGGIMFISSVQFQRFTESLSKHIEAVKAQKHKALYESLSLCICCHSFYDVMM